ncbi:MAG: ATP-dependent zinc metalloprotease FtsH [Pseudomonadales bacterium]|nr:ATP-dependent zinc metalloprotease FtsH [Pseudomonadales bacterium]
MQASNKPNDGGKSGDPKLADTKSKPPIFDWRPFVFTFIVFLIYYLAVDNQVSPVQSLSYSAFKSQVAEGLVSSVTIKGAQISGRLINSNSPPKRADFRTVMPAIHDETLLPLLEDHRVEVTARSEETPLWVSIIISVLPWVLIFGLFAYSNHVMRGRMGGGSGGGMFGFGRSKARLYEKVETDISFAEVAGLESAKQDLQEVIEYLRQPQKFRRLGAKLPKGMLMMGPPGTGKTLLAKATAAEAGVPFFSISGSEFVEMFVGVGASRVRSMFDEAREKAPALIFIDEIDAVGRARGAGMGGGNDEREQTLNQILVEMDGFEPQEKVIVMAATNRPDVLDPALLRPGRFDRRVTLDLPDRADREEILGIHAQKKPLAEDVDLKVIAERTPGFSGADLYSLMNEGAILAARENRKHVSQFDLIRSIEKVMLGPERKSRIISKREKKITAYHEAGHAIVSSVLPYADPVHKISIVARGHAGGYTLKLPVEERKLQSRKEFLDEIAVSLGGYAAELRVFDDITTGPSHDLAVATALARDMVGRYGMSELIGPVAFESAPGKRFLGTTKSEGEYSDEVAATIDKEVTRIITEGLARAKEIIEQNKDAFEAITTYLLEKETIERKEYEDILRAHGIVLKDEGDKEETEEEKSE